MSILYAEHVIRLNYKRVAENKTSFMMDKSDAEPAGSEASDSGFIVAMSIDTTYRNV